MLFHKRNVRRNDSLGAALHKAKHFLLGWGVKVIKKDAPDAPPLPTMDDKEVIITPGKHSRAMARIKGGKKKDMKISVSISAWSSLLDSRQHSVLTFCPAMKTKLGLSTDFPQSAPMQKMLMLSYAKQGRNLTHVYRKYMEL